MRIAINGLGRIGKNFLWSLVADKEALKKITIAAINIGPAKQEFVPHLFKYDSILGTFPGDVSLKDNNLCIDSISIPLIAELNAERLPWKQLGIDWVVDCSGKYTHREKAQQHLKAGARGVLISAPAHGDDVTIIPGVNNDAFNKEKHHIVSLGSCTTNALVPLLKVLREHCGLQQGFFTSIHAYTNSQVLLDVNDHDLRRCRAAALNIIPTTTGASESVAKVIPALKDVIKGVAVRVPVDIVSLIDLTFESNQLLTKELIQGALRLAAKAGSLKGIIGHTDQPLVSSDFKKTNFSVVVDELLTEAQEKTGKVFGWYDNEWGYSQRLKDFLLL